jgi:hypothetical protein
MWLFYWFLSQHVFPFFFPFFCDTRDFFVILALREPHPQSLSQNICYWCVETLLTFYMLILYPATLLKVFCFLTRLFFKTNGMVLLDSVVWGEQVRILIFNKLHSSGAQGASSEHLGCFQIIPCGRSHSQILNRSAQDLYNWTNLKIFLHMWTRLRTPY